MLIIAVIVALISAFFWMIEINYGLKNADNILKEKSIFKSVLVLPRVIMGFWAFIIDLIISSFFIAFFGIAGSVTGMVVGLACSDLFSIWILIRMFK